MLLLFVMYGMSEIKVLADFFQIVPPHNNMNFTVIHKTRRNEGDVPFNTAGYLDRVVSSNTNARPTNVLLFFKYSHFFWVFKSFLYTASHAAGVNFRSQQEFECISFWRHHHTGRFFSKNQCFWRFFILGFYHWKIKNKDKIKSIFCKIYVYIL